METVIPFDPTRLFWGEEAPLFYLEIMFRVVVIWVWSILLLRWIGGRSISQLSLLEFLLVIALGSAIGDPLFQPQVPLFHAMLVIAALVALDKIIDLGIRLSPWAKRAIDGKPVQVLSEGVIQCEGLGLKELGSPEVMERLRLMGVENLGSLSSVWLEPSGQISVFPATTPRPGLRIVPPPEVTPPEPAVAGEPACCASCGAPARAGGPPCTNCGAKRLTRAYPAPNWPR